MSVEKFRHVDDLGKTSWVSPDSPGFADRVAGLWQTSLLLSGYTPPRGVQKFRTLEEADAERQARMIARMRRRAQELGLVDRNDAGGGQPPH